MAQTEFQRALKGTSAANRYRGHRAYRSRLLNREAGKIHVEAMTSSLVAWEEFQKEYYGGIVDLAVLRSPLRAEFGKPEVVTGNAAQWECAGWAEVIDTDGTTFEGHEGKQVRYLMTLDDTFVYPSFNGAITEILDAGCAIKTKKAIYKLQSKSVRPRTTRVISEKPMIAVITTKKATYRVEDMSELAKITARLDTEGYEYTLAFERAK